MSILKEWVQNLSEAAKNETDEIISTVSKLLGRRPAEKRETDGGRLMSVMFKRPEKMSPDQLENALIRKGFTSLMRGSYSTDWVGGQSAKLESPAGTIVYVHFGNTRGPSYNQYIEIYQDKSTVAVDPVMQVVNSLESIEGGVKAQIKKMQGGAVAVHYSYGDVSLANWQGELKDLGYRFTITPTADHVFMKDPDTGVTIEIKGPDSRDPGTISFMIRPPK